MPIAPKTTRQILGIALQAKQKVLGKTLPEQTASDILDHAEYFFSKNPNAVTPPSGSGPSPSPLVPAAMDAVIKGASAVFTKIREDRERVAATTNASILHVAKAEESIAQGENQSWGQYIKKQLFSDGSDNLDYDVASAFKTNANKIVEGIPETTFSTWLGMVQNREAGHRLIKSIFSESDSGDPVMDTLASRWRGYVDDVQVRAKAVGMDLADLKGYGLSLPAWLTSTAKMEMHKLGDVKYAKFMLPLLNREMYTDRLGRQLGDEDLTKILKGIYQKVVEGIDPSAAAVKRDLDFMSGEAATSEPVTGEGTSNPDRHRTLHFKDAESFIVYNTQLLDVPPTFLIMNYINNTEKRLAIARRFGPNPSATFGKLMKDGFAKDIAKLPNDAGEDKFNRIRKDYRRIEGMFAQAMGATDPTPSNRFLRTFRNFTLAAVLGRVVLSALPVDLTTRASGLMIHKASHIDAALASLRVLFGEDRHAITSAMETSGLILNGMIEDFSRFAYEGVASDGSNKMLSAIFRIQGLMKWTDSARVGFQYAVMVKTANMLNRIASFSDLQADDQRILNNHNINPLVFALMKAAMASNAKISTHLGKQVLTPEMIRSVDEKQVADILDSPEVSDWVYEQSETIWNGVKKARDKKLSDTKKHLDKEWEFQKAIHAAASGHGYTLGKKRVIDEAAWNEKTRKLQLLAVSEFSQGIYGRKDEANPLRWKQNQENARKILVDQAAKRYTAMLLQAQDYAVVTPTPMEREWMMEGVKPGTIAGEMWTMFMTLKAFSYVFVFHRFLPELARRRNILDKTMYASGMIASLTVAGYIANLLKNLTDGKDPDELGRETVVRALMTGGGLGFYGDVINGVIHSSGNSDDLMKNMVGLAGPVAGRAFDALAVVGAVAAPEGKKWTKFVNNSTMLAQGVTPGANLWMSKAIVDRLVWDNIKDMADPNFEQKELKRQRMAGTSFWAPRPWGAGSLRAPKMGRMIKFKK